VNVSSEECWVLALESFAVITFIVSDSLGKKCSRFCCVHAINLCNIMWEKFCFSSVSLWGVPRRAGVNLSFTVSGWVDEGTFYFTKIQPLRWDTTFAFHSSELEVSK